jgi:hypothetical protein
MTELKVLLPRRNEPHPNAVAAVATVRQLFGSETVQVNLAPQDGDEHAEWHAVDEVHLIQR